MNATPATGHLSDADLVRHLDNEGGADEHDRRENHLRTCALCAGRADRLARHDRDLRTWLHRADHDPRPGAPPAPAARRPRPAFTPWLKAAAIVLLLAAPLAALPPVREWVAERIGIAPDDQDPAPAMALQAEDRAIRFTPAAGTFTIRVDAPAPDARLALGRAEGLEAVLEGAAEASPPVVSETGLRLAPAAGARYGLRLPAAVRDVVVLTSGGTVRVPAAALDTGSVVTLSVNR